ncbi:hypothetical protein O6H91_02G099700 [Diphasiastrum complanatum]|uniref:Uncharacterized protein n=1 Tax=Diphasiastrum complanatum TaxID=34168 RepID=A0ACC2EIY7_DIPCM|nr:hypothetical protein O6H91_02G099700 [Diphasiastrum complanatum]
MLRVCTPSHWSLRCHTLHSSAGQDIAILSQWRHELASNSKAPNNFVCLCTSEAVNWKTLSSDRVVKVAKANAMPLNVPLLAPFTIASTKLEHVQNVAIRVELSDGSIGWGESPTLPPVTAEDQQAALSAASLTCGLLEQNSDMSSHQLFTFVGSTLPGHRFASVRAGVEMALIDAIAHCAGVSLWQFFGGSSNHVITDITIPICNPEEAAALAGSYALRGFDTLKVKVGGRSIEADITMLKAIRRSHPECSLILDANGGYDADEALDFLKLLDDACLTPALFEQPVPRDDWKGLGEVNRKAKEMYGVSVAADESCRNLLDAEIIIKEQLAEVVNIKLAKSGVMGAMEIVTAVKNAGLNLMIGGMVETRLAMGFAAHFAAGLGCFKFIDLDTPLLLSRDPIHDGYEGYPCINYNEGLSI